MEDVSYITLIAKYRMLAVSFREKSYWASLVAVMLGYGVYFALLIPRLSVDPLRSRPYFGLLFGCVVGLVVLQITMQAGLAVVMRKEAGFPKDERERLIGRNSDRVALVAMSAMIGGVWWLYVAGPAFVAQSAVMANLVLLVLVLGTIAKYVSAIVYFHRGP